MHESAHSQQMVPLVVHISPALAVHVPLSSNGRYAASKSVRMLPVKSTASGWEAAAAGIGPFRLQRPFRFRMC